MVRIITDSTCDLTKERLQELGVICVPLTVYMGDTVYHDGEDLTKNEFYNRLRNETIFPKTAQPTPHRFAEEFSAALERGEEIICIVISSDISGTYQSANVAASEFENMPIHIIDSRTGCIALGLLVEIAADLAKQGKDTKTIVDHIQKLTSRIRLQAGVETLEYLKRGGRLSATSAIIGDMLHVRPYFGVLHGQLVPLGKVRGNKKLYQTLCKNAQEEGIDAEYPIIVGHAGSMKNYEGLLSYAKSLSNQPLLYGEVGCVIGAHAGPGTVAIAYITK